MSDQAITPAGETKPQDVDPAVRERALQQLRADQRLWPAIGAGLAAALISAVLWALITVSTNYQIGFMAIGVGWFVGYAVRLFGKGVDQVFGVAGAVLALLGCVAGNLFSACHFLAAVEKVGVFSVISSLTPSLAASLLQASFSGMDLLFYGFAVYEGYRFAFRQSAAA
jgi:hypothetical protein